MSETIPSAGGDLRCEDGHATARRATEWLTGLSGTGEAEFLCLTADHASPLSGMVAMYALMSAFHSPPWLKLIFGRRNGARRA